MFGGIYSDLGSSLYRAVRCLLSLSENVIACALPISGGFFCICMSVSVYICSTSASPRIDIIRHCAKHASNTNDIQLAQMKWWKVEPDKYTTHISDGDPRYIEGWSISFLRFHQRLGQVRLYYLFFSEIWNV